MKQSEKRILVVDDSPQTIEVISRILKNKKYQVEAASSVGAAIELLEKKNFSLVITDYRMPQNTGMDLVRYVRENHRQVSIIMMTGYASIDHAIEAVKAGVEEYLTKPVTGPELLSVVSKVFEKRAKRRETLSSKGENPYSEFGLYGTSPSMQSVYEAIAQAADSNATVLITGESGTGKELVARSIHYSGTRKMAPFLPINCGGIPDSLFESELFGHVKGAFTGATYARAGFFQSADGGTIFLDEIAEMSQALQVKLLRVIQDRQIMMVGSSKTRQVDVQILAATNKNLAEMIKTGAFREDLYYRLNVLIVDLPPLRERREDIIPLIHHFTEKICRDLPGDAPVFSDDALENMRAHHWAGNVRELENFVHRLLLMNKTGVIDVSAFPENMRFTLPAANSPMLTLEKVENLHILRVLKYVEGNKTHAAEILGISRKTLREKLKRFS